MKQRARHQPAPAAPKVDRDAPPTSSEPPAMAPIITNTGDDDDGAPTG